MLQATKKIQVDENIRNWRKYHGLSIILWVDVNTANWGKMIVGVKYIYIYIHIYIHSAQIVKLLKIAHFIERLKNVYLMFIFNQVVCYCENGTLVFNRRIFFFFFFFFFENAARVLIFTYFFNSFFIFNTPTRKFICQRVKQCLTCVYFIQLATWNKLTTRELLLHVNWSSKFYESTLLLSSSR